MKKFAIQTIKNEIKHDFCFELLRSLEYWEWAHRSKEFDYVLCESSKDDCIPVGSVEFVIDHLLKIGKEPKPWNVPKCLFEYAGREIQNTKKHCIDLSEDSFIKSNEKIKGFSAFSEEIGKSEIEALEDTEYQVSSIIDIWSEYRCFVYRNKLLDVRRYSGDFDIFPDISTIYDMISDFKNYAPVAYTLDVAVLHRGKTVIMEVHDFFSCGLYGFNDKMYPMMLIDWYNEFSRKQRR